MKAGSAPAKEAVVKETKDRDPNVPFCLYLNNKMDILHVTHNESLQYKIYKIIVTKSFVVQQVTVQYKWIQY